MKNPRTKRSPCKASAQREAIHVYWGMVGEASKEVVAFEQDLGELNFDIQKRRGKNTGQRLEHERSCRSVETCNRKSGCLMAHMKGA